MSLILHTLGENITEKIMKSNLPHVKKGGSRTASKSKVERFVITVNGFKPLAFITKCSILDVAAVLDPHLVSLNILHCFQFFMLSYYIPVCQGGRNT